MNSINIRKRYPIMLSALIILCALFCCSAGAAGTTVAASGISGANGSNIAWTLYSDGLLTIDGSGEMGDDSPWRSYDSSWGARIRSVVIQDGITSIGANAFAGCDFLTSAVIPDSVTTIGNYAFQYCRKLTNVTLGDGLTQIGNYAFSNCSILVEINLPEGLITIGENAFEYCYALSDVTIPNSMTSIGRSVFRACGSLKSVVIPESITSIGDYAFFSCDSLTSVTIPESVTSIGQDTFSYCSDEFTAHVYGSSYAYTYCKDNNIPYSVFRVYPESKHPYDNDSNEVWNYTDPEPADYLKITFSAETEFEYNHDKLIISYTDVDGNKVSFMYTGTSLASRTFIMSGNSFTLNLISDSSGKYYGFAFTEIAAMTKEEYEESLYTINSAGTITCYSGQSADLIIPDVIQGIPVTGIGDNAFSCRSKLTSVTIPDAVAFIGSSAFVCCDNLTSITIPEKVTSIGNNAFYGCSSLTGIVIPDNVASVGQSVFYGCTSLKSIIIPDNITSIGEEAFKNCSSLDNVTIGNGVTSIGAHAFEGCSNLTIMNFPDSITSIGESAFAGCSKCIADAGNCGDTAAYVLDSNGVFTVYGKGEMWDYAPANPSPASNTYSVKTAVIKNGITKIGKYAFDVSPGMTGVSIPDSVTSIGDYAFRDCWALTDVAMPDSVTAIGKYAFCNCKVLTNIAIPVGVTSINDSAFYACGELTEVDIPDGVTSIGEQAFRFCGNLTEVEIPDGVTTIGAYAFDNCEALKSVTVPISVTFIGYDAFTNYSEGLTIRCHADSCAAIYADKYGLGAVVEPHNEESIPGVAATCTADGLTEGKHCQVCGRVTVEQIVIPALGHTWGKPDIVLKATCTEDGIQQFTCSACGVFTTEAIPAYAHQNTTETVNSSVSRYEPLNDQEHNTLCMRVTTVICDDCGKIVSSKTEEYYVTAAHIFSSFADDTDNVCDLCGYRKAEITPTPPIAAEPTPTAIPTVMPTAEPTGEPLPPPTLEPTMAPNEDGFVIEDGVLIAYVGNASDLVIPDDLGITKIGGSVFEDNDSLISVVVPDGITSIGNSAFASCDSLTTVTLPGSLNRIEDGAFYDCTSLAGIRIPEGVTYVGWRAFGGCTSMKELILPGSLRNIGEVFVDCGSLTSLVIPEGVESLTAYAFIWCYDLTDVTLPESLISIGANAFRESKLTEIIIPAGVVSIGANAFGSDDNPELKAYVYADTYGHNYCAANGIAYEILEGTPDSPDAPALAPLSDFVLENGVIVKYTGSGGSIIVPDGVTAVGDEAFKGCAGVTYVKLPDGVTSIGNGAFQDCVVLTEIEIPDSVTHIGCDAFYSCESLKTIVIPEGVKKVENYTFNGCFNLKNVSLPSTLLAVGNDAFCDCLSLVDITIPEGVTIIGTYAFAYCTRLQNVDLPDSLIRIEGGAFGACHKLTGITLPASLRYISEWVYTGPDAVAEPEAKVTSYVVEGSYAHEWCIENNFPYKIVGGTAIPNDNVLVLPDSMYEIGKEAFMSVNANGVIIPNGAYSIGSLAFANCKNLTYVFIPASVDDIAEDAFAGCDSLVIYCKEWSTAYNFAVGHDIQVVTY